MYLGASRSDNRARAVNGVSSNSQQLMNKIAAHFSHLAEPRDPHGEVTAVSPIRGSPHAFYARGALRSRPVFARGFLQGFGAALERFLISQL
ncbi:hypothetical protein SKAU_G00219610 [Synaphobranchus kaupii]|uniref:Uncharacterized protein n=1 Tax=Synaphobranchus kaupii TaxID=118154 RepID=A0A9Q1IVD5_SYNKA|nr:hypothetical protein SKAU_G00219610 [Synaphobranchus kaupii]